MKSDSVYVGHIYERTSRILNLTTDMRFDGFEENFLVQDSVIRSLEIIGEAASQVSERFREEHPELPLREMKGLRNVLIHAYSDVDLKRVWVVVKENIPPLHEDIVRILKEYGVEV